jgi:hypothetical protein
MGKKTCKLFIIKWYALYRIDVSSREVPGSFVLILPTRVLPAGGRWENPGALTFTFFNSADYVRR